MRQARVTVWLDPAARHQIEREASRRRFVETGGPLFGFEADDDVVVIGVGGPGPNGRHRPRSFRPDRDAVDRAIACVHEASEGRYRFLGSWHTHPFGRPRPSGTDLLAARGISAEPEVVLPRPFVIIHATWPTRRTFRDRDLRAFRWEPALSGLVAIDVRIVREDERRHPVLDVDWDEVVA
jgi:integrative and conjugative element protein (TIGR02256 family)